MHEFKCWLLAELQWDYILQIVTQKTFYFIDLENVLSLQ